MYSYGPLHLAEQKQGDQLEPTYRCSVKMRGVALRTCWKRWTIERGGERESGISVLVARQDDEMIIIIIIKNSISVIIKTHDWKNEDSVHKNKNTFVSKIL